MLKRLPIELFLVTHTDAEPGALSYEQRIDLLPYLDEWIPGSPALKEGGLFLSGAYTDGREIALALYENVTEALSLKPHARSPEALIALIRQIRYFLRRARAYHIAWWQDKPVYLQALSRREANRRYAVLANGRAPQDSNPYADSLDSDVLSAIEGWPLELERGHWLSNKPGDATATACIGRYNTATLFGNVTPGGTLLPDTTGAVYASNKSSLYNLSHIFTYDAAPPTFSANLLAGALPYNLLPAGAAVGDMVYFIRQQIGGRSYSFDNIVFNLAVVGAGYTAGWQYYNGAWVSLNTLRDNTSTLKVAGVSSLHFKIPSDWVALAINGVTGLAVRMVLSAAGAVTRPQQQTQHVYTTGWPHTYIQASQVGGDLPATLRMRLVNQSDNISTDPSFNYLHAHRVIVGLRSEARGPNFVSHMPLSFGDDPWFGTFTLGTNAAYTADVTVPWGRRVTFAPVGVGTETVLLGELQNGVTAPHYRGRFRVFLRARQSGGAAGDILLRLELRSGNPISNPDWTSEYVPFLNTDPWQILEFGEMQIGAADYGSAEQAYNTTILISAQVVSATPDVHLYDLILIPVDEWSGEFASLDSAVASSLGKDVTYGVRLLEIDSVIDLKRPIRALLRVASGYFERWASWEAIAAGPAILQVNADQRLFFLATRYADPADLTDQRSEFEVGFSVQLVRTQRYETLRGEG